VDDLAATMIINGAGVITWLFPGSSWISATRVTRFCGTPCWILASASGVVVLHAVKARIDGVGVARQAYALACFIGLLGLVGLAYAPDALLGSVGVCS
jgi:hypothetical protein